MDWVADGQVNVSLDNLIADQLAASMVVVMPQSNPRQSGDPAEDGAAFEKFFFHDVIPFVEDRYPILDGRESRAIAGQSMGGFLAFALRHPDRFAGVGVFGAGANGEEGRKEFEEFAADPERISSRPDVFDMLMRDAIQLDEFLSEREIEHRFLVVEIHGHTWPFWRIAISELLPLLFRDRALRAQ